MVRVCRILKDIAFAVACDELSSQVLSRSFQAFLMTYAVCKIDSGQREVWRTLTYRTGNHMRDYKPLTLLPNAKQNWLLETEWGYNHVNIYS